MRVTNIHKRKLPQSLIKVSPLLHTLGTDNDAVWPNENWPSIYFIEGLKKGSPGGHGIIKYTIVDYNKAGNIIFNFTKPKGFEGIHEFKLEAISENETLITHDIQMHTTTIKATWFWIVAIRWLHDALIEEAFDNMESQFSEVKIKPKYTLWVKFLRCLFKRKALKLKYV